MSKIVGAKELRHQPYWDALIVGTPAAFQPRTAAQLATSPIRMFTGNPQGNMAVSNMEAAGAFPSDQTYRILSMRVWLYFRQTAIAGVGPGPLDHQFYHRAMNQLYWQLEVAQKQAFTAPTPYFPYGGGLFGDVGTSTDVYFNSGNPQQSGIMKLARSIALPARQNFMVNCYILALGAFNWATDMAALTAGEVNVTFTIDGLHVRDIL